MYDNYILFAYLLHNHRQELYVDMPKICVLHSSKKCFYVINLYNKKNSRAFSDPYNYQEIDLSDFDNNLFLTSVKNYCKHIYMYFSRFSRLNRYFQGIENFLKVK